MRALCVGNMYPPHHLGGYELLWRSATEHLRREGHHARVLTTDYRRPGLDPGEVEADEDVHRQLRWYWRNHEFPRIGVRARIALERHNRDTLERHVSEFRPDVIGWWAMGGLSLGLIEQVRRMKLPAVGVVGDDWLVYGRRVDAFARLGSRPLVGTLLERLSGLSAGVDLDAAADWLFISESLRTAAQDASGPLARTSVEHPGVDLGLFSAAEPAEWRCRLLYAGRIDPRKGIANAVRALARLPEAKLVVDGRGDDGHLAELRALAQATGVAERVTFQQSRREDLPGVYAGADAVLQPVMWAEPFGLVPLEAMAVGRPVIATGVGGAGEYLTDGLNCLLVPLDDDGTALAAAIERLADDSELRTRLREGGLATAADHPERRFNDAVLTTYAGAAAGGPEPAA